MCWSSKTATRVRLTAIAAHLQHTKLPMSIVHKNILAWTVLLSASTQQLMACCAQQYESSWGPHDCAHSVHDSLPCNIIGYKRSSSNSFAYASTVMATSVTVTACKSCVSCSSAPKKRLKDLCELCRQHKFGLQIGLTCWGGTYSLNCDICSTWHCQMQQKYSRRQTWSTATT